MEIPLSGTRRTADIYALASMHCTSISMGLSREDTSYVLDTFPIVRRQDEAEFGSYRTKEMVLEYMSALSEGDVETRVQL